MKTITQSLLTQIHSVNPYEGFDYQAIPENIQGWGSEHEIFGQFIELLKPKLILEVGTWKGASAIHMAKLLQEKGIDAVIICIDTWLGGLEHLLNDQHPELGLSRFRKYGYPTLYYQFLANVMHTGLQNYIVPFPTTSRIASKWLEHYQIKADLIYIDASHDENDVYDDLVSYWKLLKLDGILFGDDWSPTWDGVVSAVSKFAKTHHLKIGINEDKWFLNKSEPISLST